jgi:hypothetical protein
MKYKYIESYQKRIMAGRSVHHWFEGDRVSGIGTIPLARYMRAASTQNACSSAGNSS